MVEQPSLPLLFLSSQFYGDSMYVYMYMCIRRHSSTAELRVSLNNRLLLLLGQKKTCRSF